ncbi:hypothetical protein BGZ72_009671 [Mortierella alpina]|nr:hypothetical protein BGZ72_009671 [Mortierella alpina]
MRLSIIALAFTGISTVLAKIYITTPVAETVWKAGEDVTINWQGHVTEPQIANLRIRKDRDFVVVYGIGTVQPGSNSLRFTLRSNLESGSYAIEIGEIYTHQFRIDNNSGNGVSDRSVSLTTISVAVAAAAAIII